MVPTAFVLNEMKMSVVKIFSYQDENLKGSLANPYFEKEIFFESTTQLLFLINDLQNALNFPRENMNSRSFTKESKILSSSYKDTASFAGESALATFNIKVLFRQNVSWQGSICWIDEKADAQFRSTFELIILMHSALKSLCEE